MRLTLIAALAAAATAISGTSCMSSVDATYEFPNINLAWLNPHLTTEKEYQALVKRGCPDNRPSGDVCHDKPAIGSGLTQLHANYFLGLTDRGPNQDCGELADDPERYPEAIGKKGKGFPIVSFAPSIVHFETGDSREIVKRFAVPLRGSDGNTISGLPNTPDDDTPYGMDCKGKPLKYDPSGLDTEDIARIPDTKFAVIVDEYSPSVVIADYNTGVIAARHVPSSKATALNKAMYPIIGDIPDVFANRRKNRGFEGVVVDGKGKYAIAILQSPMLGDDAEKTSKNRIIRCALFKIKLGQDGIPHLSYKHSFVIEASPVSSYFNEKNKPADMKYSAAQYHSPGKFVVLERAKSQVKLFLVDFLSATNLDKTTYADNLGLEMETNGVKSARQVGVIAAEKTLIWDSSPGVGGTTNWEGGSKQDGFAIDMDDPTKVWMMQDNDFGLEGNRNVKLFKISLGRSASGATVCPRPAHPFAPKINVMPSKALKLVKSQTYRISKTVGGGAAENMDLDEEAVIAYVANDESGAINTYNVSTSPVTPLREYKIKGDYKPTSTSVCKSLDRVAIAFANSNDSMPGRIDIVSKDLKLERYIQNKACFLPDSVKWSEDCSYLVVDCEACEGEGKDIPGGILVGDYDNEQKSFRGAKLATFEPYDEMSEELKINGVRLIESDKASLDLQPEFVSIVGKHAFVTIQESNAIAVVDLAEAKVTELKPIGFIDRSRKGFAIDASNKDGGINIRNYPFLYGMPQPDTIVSYTAGNGKTYLIIANEGDALESEEARAADITNPEKLNRTAVPGLKKLVEDEKLLGRLKFSTVEGYDAETNTQYEIYHFGSRSFSIMSLDGDIVFDSGEWLARIMEKHFPKIFNANGFDDEDLKKSQADLMDNRSDDKGGEPESLAVMTTKQGKTYAFIGLERPSIIVVFDVTDPMSPIFVDATQNNPYDTPIDQLFQEGKQGDIDPEGMFASLKLRKLVVSGSVSNTVSTYDIEGL